MSEPRVPHAEGHAQCGDCDHRWSATWALGADNLICPACDSTDTDREQVGGFVGYRSTRPGPTGGAPAWPFP